MKPLGHWRTAVPPQDAQYEMQTGRGGLPTLRVRGSFLHSRYNPEQEAERLVASAQLDPSRPVLVLGLGLGYHVKALREQGYGAIAVEPDPTVAALCAQAGLLAEDTPVATGPVEALQDDPDFTAFARRQPQLFVHPPTARLHAGYEASLTAALAHAALAGQRLSVAIVGPLYGGSLPIAGYLADAFERLGHAVLRVDNTLGWNVYQTIDGSIQDKHAGNQLGGMLSNLFGEWSYARVAEFQPELCIVLAQAPVKADFPQRLRKHGIVSAFWFVENWRHMPYWQEIAPHSDAFFHIQPGEFERRLEAIGCSSHAYMQTACDPQRHRPVQLSREEHVQYGCDVSFAGAGYYNRHQFFRGLTDYNLKLWGVNWRTRELAVHLAEAEGWFDTETFMKIIAGSRINLNLHSSTTHGGVSPDCDAINPRVFEIAAAGGFQICDPCKGLDQLFDLEQELPAYRNLGEARALIDYYLAHPEERRAVAERARQRALAGHTYEHRARQMLAHLIEHHGGRILRRGVRVQQTVSEVAKASEPDAPLRQWLETLPSDLPFTHEELRGHVGRLCADAPYPEQLFAYLGEMRNYAEMLLREKR